MAKILLEPGIIKLLSKHPVSNDDIDLTFKNDEFFSFLDYIFDKFKDSTTPDDPTVADLQEWYNDFIVSITPIPEPEVIPEE
jgi:hypothetical protein